MNSIFEQKKVYRPGALGSLIDEYERAICEIQEVVRSVPADDFTRISNLSTADPDCLSVQTIVRHTISAGYGYATYIRKALDIEGIRPEIPVVSQSEAISKLGDMFEYTLKTFEGQWDMEEEKMLTTRFTTNWSEYDIDSMLEHAIVHILRHRRQIEKLVF